MLHQIANADPGKHVFIPGQQLIAFAWLWMPRPDEDVENLRAARDEQAFHGGPNHACDVPTLGLLLIAGSHAKRHATAHSLAHQVIEPVRLNVQIEPGPARILVQNGHLIADQAAVFGAVQRAPWLLLLTHLKLNPLCAFTWLYVAFRRGPTSR